MRVLHGLLHRDAGDRHQRADVHAAEARVFTGVLAHVDELGTHPRGADGSLDDLRRLAHEGEDGPIGGAAGVDVQQGDSVGRADGVGDGVENRGIAPLGEVGDALDELCHGSGAAIEVRRDRPGLRGPGRGWGVSRGGKRRRRQARGRHRRGCLGSSNRCPLPFRPRASSPMTSDDTPAAAGRAGSVNDRAAQAVLFDACFSRSDGADVLPWRYDASPHGEALTHVVDGARTGSSRAMPADRERS